MSGPVVSMLPARNAAADLPAHLESVARVADVVVALDDGSTDETGEILRAHPLVATVLSNPRRDSYVGWDDRGNRQRLLTAALELDASWAISLDADELIPAEDAEAMARFLAHDADPGAGYLLRALRMIGDLRHHSGEELWVGRVFAPRPGHRFPDGQLHFVPLPTAIGRDKWVRTTFRILHHGALTDERRQARRDKYRQADPDHRWQASYDHLTRVPRHTVPLAPRGRLLPAVLHAPVVDDQPLAPGEPAMSVVIIGRGDSTGLVRSVEAAVAQELDEPFEVVVVTSGPGTAADDVRLRHPDVAVIHLDQPALPGAARNAGLAAASGRWITFPGSHIELTPGALAARLAAHRSGWPMVTETVHNGTDTPAGWASWFLDNAGQLGDGQPAALDQPPIRCSYHRDLLDEVGGFPDVRTGEDTAVNEALFSRGYGAWWARDCVTIHHSPCDTLGRLVVHHRQRGLGRARLLIEGRDTGVITDRAMIRSALVWAPARIRWIHRQSRTADVLTRRRYRRSVFHIVAGATAAGLGCWEGLVRPLAARVIPGRTER